MAISRRPSRTSKREKRVPGAPTVGSGDKFAEESFPNVVLRAPGGKKTVGRRSRGPRGVRPG
jgi:hypothetical protein